MSYSRYVLSRSNMRLHLKQKHEERLNIIDSKHNEAMQRYSNERNRNNNFHVENMQRYLNQKNRDNNSHTENMQRLSNEREDKQNMRNNERRLNEQRHEINITKII